MGKPAHEPAAQCGGQAQSVRGLASDITERKTADGWQYRQNGCETCML